MKNPLLVPELRDMLAAHREDELRDFCSFTPPDVTAEFLGALNTEEQREILHLLEPEIRSQVFGFFDDDAKLPILELLQEDEAVGLVSSMQDDAREKFLERVPANQHERLRAIFLRARTGEAKPLLVQMEESRSVGIVPEPLTAEEIAAEVNQHLETYRCVAGRMERVRQPERGCWVRIVNPSKDNLPLIAEHFKVPVDFFTASLDVDETARIEVDDHGTLFIVKIPYFDEKNVDVLYFTIPVGIILVDGMIITVCTREADILKDFADNKVRNIGDGHRFILQFILRATVRYLQYLKQLNNAANIIQKKLEQESRNKQLIKLFNIEKSLVYFTTSLKSNMLMLERLRRMRLLDVNDTNENLLEDILTEGKQAIEMSNIYSDISERHDGRFRVGDLQQPQHRDEAAHLDHHHHHHPDPDRQLLRHERRVADATQPVRVLRRRPAVERPQPPGRPLFRQAPLAGTVVAHGRANDRARRATREAHAQGSLQAGDGSQRLCVSREAHSRLRLLQHARRDVPRAQQGRRHRRLLLERGLPRQCGGVPGPGRARLQEGSSLRRGTVRLGERRVAARGRLGYPARAVQARKVNARFPPGPVDPAPDVPQIGDARDGDVEP